MASAAEIRKLRSESYEKVRAAERAKRRAGADGQSSPGALLAVVAQTAKRAAQLAEEPSPTPPEGDRSPRPGQLPLMASVVSFAEPVDSAEEIHLSEPIRDPYPEPRPQPAAIDSELPPPVTAPPAVTAPQEPRPTAWPAWRAWVIRQRPRKVSRWGVAAMKDVLAVLAERATAEGLSHPSASYIAGKTGYHLRTVQQVLEALALAELIAHTGQMTGRTGRVKVWQLGPLTVLADTAGNASTDGSVMRVQTGGNASTNPDLMRVQTGGNASTRNAGTSGNAELSVVDRKALSVGDRTRVPAHTREAPIPPPPSPQNDGPGQPSAEVLEVDPMAADIDSGPLPPRYCPDHPKGTRDPCAACGDARERRQLEERRRKRAADSLLYRFEEIRLDTRNCPHGEPGGYLIHPKHRKPHKCGLCRALYRTAGEDLDLYRAELAEAWRIEAAR